jgi:two-component sensor histidine kinase
MRRPDLAVEVSVVGDEIALPSQAATSLALAVNELIQNALEHAFPGREQGCVIVHLQRTSDCLTVEVRDDGVGLSESLSRHLGLEIVETLIREDLKGECRLSAGSTSADSGTGGTVALLTIPLEVRG